MLKIMKDCWNRNSDKLRAELMGRKDLDDFSYEDLVKLTFETIFDEEKLDFNNIAEIDNGSYQGTILFVIPFDTYQPSEYEYLMTYIGYGSCSYCDALQRAQMHLGFGDDKGDDEGIPEFMSICKDLICNCIRPYNNGWRQDDKYDQVNEEG